MKRNEKVSIRGGLVFPRAVVGRFRSVLERVSSGGASRAIGSIDKKAEANTSPPVRDGPLVSVVVQANVESRLNALLEELAATSYRPLEVIVVLDEACDVARSRLPGDAVIVTADGWLSAASAQNAGADAAQGEFVLFLPTAADPIGRDWLGHMVASHQKVSAAAVGSLVASPANLGEVRTIRSGGVQLGGRGGAPVLTPQMLSEMSLAELPSEWDVEAIGSGALLVRKDDFHEVGGFDTSFFSDFEMIDLSLRLATRGRLVIARDAVFEHDEPSEKSVDEVDRLSATHNRQMFAEKWGARFTRTRLRRHLLQPSRNRTVAVTLPPDDPAVGDTDHQAARRLGQAFESQGWTVLFTPPEDAALGDIPADTDLFISLVDGCDVRRVPDSVIRIAWILRWVDRWIERPWFDTFDVVYAASRMAVETIGDRTLVKPMLMAPAVDVQSFTPGPAPPLFQTDYVFVGNNVGSGRILQDVWDVRPGETAIVLGRGWESVPRYTRYWRGHLQHQHLPSVFRGAKVTLDDTPRALKSYGLLNDTVLEALACGSLVVTDNEAASNEFFESKLPVYRDWKELRTNLDRFVVDGAVREELVGFLRGRVLANHDIATVPNRLLESLTATLDQLTFAVKVASPSAEAAPLWGDTHFGSAMVTALQKRGLQARLDILPNWDLPAHQEVDVVIHVRGRKSYFPKPAHINVMWLISHPEEVTPSECDGYDLILVASRQYADHLRPLTSTPVHFFPQATDGRRFAKGPRTKNAARKALFVGNTRGVERPAVSWALEQGVPLTVYGRGWEELPATVFAGEHVPNEELPSLYRSAGVVLNDHWSDMREHGFVSNRIFDVLGAGGVVVSDDVSELEDLFGDLVPTFRTPRELGEVVRALLDDPSMRQKLGDQGASLVKEQHTFDRRAEQLIELVRPLLESHPMDLEGKKPTV